jgi:hypothetical protein
MKLSAANSTGLLAVGLSNHLIATQESVTASHCSLAKYSPKMTNTVKYDSKRRNGQPLQDNLWCSIKIGSAWEEVSSNQITVLLSKYTLHAGQLIFLGLCYHSGFSIFGLRTA